MLMRNRIAATVVILASALPACAPLRPGPEGLARLDIGVRFALENLCSGGLSPPIAISPAPRGAASYAVRLTNVSVLRQVPSDWRIPIPSDPARIPYAALAGYAGPCHGDHQNFAYRVEVLALDGGGAPLAYGYREVRVEPVNVLARDLWGRGQDGIPDPELPPIADSDYRDIVLRDREFGVPERPRSPRREEFIPRPGQAPVR